MTARRVALLALFVALVVALGYALSGVPNVELMTLTAFVAGSVVGTAGGAVVGAIGMALYSAFNPYGLAPPPVYAAQVLGLAGIGAAGGALRTGRLLAPGPGTALRILLGALVGGGLTLAYDFLTNLGTAWAIGALSDPWPVIAGGLAFGAWHVVGNAVLFAVAAPALLAAWRRHEALAP